MDNYAAIHLTHATGEDFANLVSFYKDVIQRTPGMVCYCPWVYGLHPTDEMIMDYIEEGSIYVCKSEETILGAVAVTPYQSSDYENIAWKKAVKKDEVAVVHILAVNPDYQKEGLSRQIMTDVEKIAADLRKKALRLDALSINTPAQKLYICLCYLFCGEQTAYAKNLREAKLFYFEK